MVHASSTASCDALRSNIRRLLREGSEIHGPRAALRDAVDALTMRCGFGSACAVGDDPRDVVTSGAVLAAGAALPLLARAFAEGAPVADGDLVAVPLATVRDRVGALLVRRPGLSLDDPAVALLVELAEVVALSLRHCTDPALEPAREAWKHREPSRNGLARCRAVLDGGRMVDWIFLEVNDAFCALTGMSDVLGRRATEVMPGDRARDPRLFDVYERVVRTGEPARFERFMLTMGKWFTVTVARPAPGEFLAVVNVIDALAHTENVERFQQMFEQAGIGIGQVVPETGRLLAVNEQMCAILGYDRSELLTKRFADFTHPDDRLGDQEMLSRLDGSRCVSREKRYLRRDGAVLWGRITVSRLPGCAGGVSTNVALLEDITEKKRAEAALHDSEERYRSLVDNLEDVVFSTDAAGALTFVGRAVRAFGYRPDALCGTPLEDLVHPQDRDLLHGLLRDAAAHPSGELRLLDAAHGIRIVRASTQPHVVDAHEVGVTGVLVDLTARRDTEDQLRAAQKMEAVGRLAGGVAHDFNNMLSVILSYAELASGDLRPEDPLHGDLSQIIAAAMRAEGLTRQLLAFSRRQLLAPEALDLNELLDGLAKMLGRMIGEDITLTIAPSEGLSRTRADRGQVEQVVMNLVVNARDALPDGGDVTLATRDVSVDRARAERLSIAPGRYVELAVADTGCGMDEATRARIFEPFFTTKEVGKGTGLGLSMVYGIVRQSGGAVEVESAPGRGATFRVLLPRDDGRAAEAPSRAPRPAATSGHEPILVVEDEPALRGVIQRVLAAAGYDVHAVGNPGEALALCEREGPRIRLILTDVIMPGMSGGALSAKLQPMCPSAKMIFMSGYTDEAIARHGVLDAEFLRKPFDGRTLSQRVRAVLDRAS